jgi:hypothetical protein
VNKGYSGNVVIVWFPENETPPTATDAYYSVIPAPSPKFKVITLSISGSSNTI